MRAPVLVLLLMYTWACRPAAQEASGIARLSRRGSQRVAVRADRRDAFLIPGRAGAAAQHDVSLELASGDRIRFAVGVPRQGEGPPRRVDFRLSWLREGAAEVRLDQVRRVSGAPWKEREVVVSDGLAGAGTLRFATWAETATPAAFAEARILRAPANEAGHGAGDAARRPLNLLVYLVDTLRPDHLSCYGARNPTSPRIDALAADGFLFEAFRAVAPWTRPTTATILTGYYPRWHGMGKELPLPESLHTLAETLRDAGYSTWGAVANPQVGEVALRFEQGFDRFVTHRGIGRDLRADQRVATSTRLGEVVLPWIEAAGDEPFFLYVHSLDPHTPYAPPSDAAESFSAGYDGPLTDSLLFTKDLKALGADGNAMDLRFVEDNYDDEVRHNDLEIGKLLDALERRGVLQNTVVAILSDHGEEFLDHGGWNHGYRMFEELLRVPLVVWLPPGLRAQRDLVPRRIATPVSQVDFLPGLLDVLGLADPFPRQGRSWAALLAGDEADLAPFLALDYQAHAGDEIGAFFDGRYKLIWNSDSEKETLSEQLFDLESDPAEQDDLARRHPAIIMRLRAERDTLLKEAARVRARLDAAGLQATQPQDETNTAPAVLDEEALHELEALGYGGD